MPRIEDIKPPKRKTPSDSEGFRIGERKEDKDDKKGKEGKDDVKGEVDLLKIKPKKSFFQFLWRFIVFIVILAVFSGFFLFSAYKTKTKLYDSLNSADNDYIQLSDSISEKNIPKISTQIKSFFEKTDSGELLLQSIGQDVFVLNLLYLKNDKPKTTSLIDNFRVAHILVYSYKNIADLKFASSESSSDEYLSKINNYLTGFIFSKRDLEKRIYYANFYAKEAKNVAEKSHTNNEATGFEGKIINFANVSFDFFRYLTNIPDELANIIGKNGKKSYLVLFLNNAEIRPGGGFIGSFARIDFENGKLVKIDFEKNIYTLDQAYIAAGNHIFPPDELKSLTSDWLMRDSNLSADFSESAKKTAWFYQQESGNKVDGIFALDTTFFRHLLSITGPIPMPEYNLNVGANNFLPEVQYQVEIGYFQNDQGKVENQPKKILADLLPKFLLEVFKEKNSSALSAAISQAVEEKHLLLYFENQKIEDLAVGIGAGGEIQRSSGDYFYQSDANIGGYKSSLNIAESVVQSVEIGSSGDLSEKLSIIRKHNGTNNWPDGINNNFLKIYLPQTAKIDNIEFVAGDNNPRSDPKLLTSDKYQISSEFGKTLLSFWQNTKPKETSETKIEYVREGALRLSDDQFDYDITIQKQPGIEKFEYNLFLTYPFGWQPKNVEGYDEINRKIYLKKTITSDEKIHLEFVRSQSKK
ncbi:MAG: hypothetical protein Athens101428_362 [Candidatus Berkelbacteria bacterium Athens1014_28]|uniref:DUF4012 domain-containing protein n=1 Tax=Candidatus Berkelbacteria bacterium Athens1014_28 TaxID=2017145 RepID=A0A554LNX1_9BACT|nr:MAG: hypothetical protein Athens101428_362 [Candidatus Berkelbacteria bacterium Athens1014_28]